MYCIKCGALLPDDAVFCSKCGAKVANHQNVNGNSSTTDSSGKCGRKLSTNLCPYCSYFQWVNEEEGEILCTKYNMEGVFVPTEEYREYQKLEERDRRIKRGFKRLEEEDNERAAKNFIKAISISPNGDAYFGLACCASRAGDYEEAINFLTESKGLYEREGDRRGAKAANNAINDIQNMVKLKKENREGLLNLGADIISKLFS